MNNIQSADTARAMAAAIRDRAQCLRFSSWNEFENDLKIRIDTRDAAQRQAGREEALAEERGTRSPGLNVDDNKRMDELVTVYSKEALADSILAWEKQSKRYAALETAAREAHTWIESVAVGPNIIGVSIKLGKALSDLENGRKG